MWKFTLAFIFLFQALTQFTSYVPSTHAEPPSFFSYGSYPHRNPFDSYSPPEENHRISNEKRLRYNEETGLLTKSNNPSQNKFSFGSNI